MGYLFVQVLRCIQTCGGPWVGHSIFNNCTPLAAFRPGVGTLSFLLWELLHFSLVGTLGLPILGFNGLKQKIIINHTYLLLLVSLLL